MADVSKTVANPLKRPVISKSKVGATNDTIKTRSTTATATKITKLVLKPKPVAAKSSLTSKVTNKKYITKPVTIKSRSTMISHESTFRIRDIKKSAPSERANEKNDMILVKNAAAQISQQFIVNGNDMKKMDQSQPFEMVHSEHSANITSLNVTKIVSNPILQEITSTVVNGSTLMKSSVNEFDANISKNVKNSPKKVAKHSENDAGKNKSKSYDPIKARQFIRMQKEKRRESEIEKSKTPATREEIKQRLSALRSNTLKIVEKNVQKARKNVDPNTKNSKSFTSKTIKEQPKSTTQKQTGKTLNLLCFNFLRFKLTYLVD